MIDPPPDGCANQIFAFAETGPQNNRGPLVMVSSTLRVMLKRALRSGIFLLVAATLSTGEEIIPAGNDASVSMPPKASQGSVDDSGKFVPATTPGGISRTPTTPAEWKASASKLIEKTGEHTFRIGIVQCDRSVRTITIPAQVNKSDGLIEYALVTRQGKIHESLLSTDAEPLHFQMAALLLGLSPHAEKPQPCEVMIDVEWATNGPARKVPLEELVRLAKGSPHDALGDTLVRGPWAFTGSQIDSKGFVASREGSVIALIEDPAALIVNPRPGREDDSLHLPNAASMPGVGLPVSVRVFLKSPDAQGGKAPADP